MYHSLRNRDTCWSKSWLFCAKNSYSPCSTIYSLELYCSTNFYGCSLSWCTSHISAIWNPKLVFFSVDVYWMSPLFSSSSLISWIFPTNVLLKIPEITVFGCGRKVLKPCLFKIFQLIMHECFHVLFRLHFLLVFVFVFLSFSFQVTFLDKKHQIHQFIIGPKYFIDFCSSVLAFFLDCLQQECQMFWTLQIFEFIFEVYPLKWDKSKSLLQKVLSICQSPTLTLHR